MSDLRQRLAALTPAKQRLLARRHPLSFAQERLWLLDRLHDGSAFYNGVGAIGLWGELDQTALAKSLEEIVSRHQVLRTTFPVVGGEPMQLVEPPRPLALPVVDLVAVVAEKRLETGLDLAARTARRSFALDREGLLIAVLARLEAARHVLFLVAHHIVCDNLSFAVLGRELLRLYASQVVDEPAPLAELPAQYLDFARWQRQRLAAGSREELLAFWQAELDGAPRQLALPTDRPRPAVESFRGGVERRALPASLRRELRALATGQRASELMVFLAAFGALLSRYSGQRELLLGTPVDHRQRLEFEGLIGLFVDTVVLRLSVARRAAATELIVEARRRVLAALEHGDLPFEALVEELVKERDLSRNPLFQVMLTVKSAEPTAVVALPGLEVETLAVREERAMFDLTLAIEGPPDATWAVLGYNRDLFDATTARRLLGHLETLLGALVAAPSRALDALPLWSPGERQQVLIELGDTAALPSALLPEQLAVRARTVPERIAVVGGEEALSYGELARRGGGVAVALVGAGVGAEEVVGVCLERSPSLLIGLWGLLNAGGAYLPLDPGLPEERLRFMLEDAGVRRVLCEEALVDHPALGDVEKLLPMESSGIAAVPSPSAVAEDPRQHGPLLGPPVSRRHVSVAAEPARRRRSQQRLLHDLPASPEMTAVPSLSVVAAEDCRQLCPLLGPPVSRRHVSVAAEPVRRRRSQQRLLHDLPASPEMTAAPSSSVVAAEDCRQHGPLLGPPASRRHLPAEANRLAYVIYTSGSTGRPKGVEISHGAFANFLAAMSEKPGLSSADRLLALTTLSFDIAGLELFLPLLHGATVILARRREAADAVVLARLLAAERANVLQATPATWWALMTAGWRPMVPFKALCGGEALTADLAVKIRAAAGELWNLYGPTETTVWSSRERIDGDRPTIGRPIRDTRVHVATSELTAQPLGIVGELWIGGGGLARGYRRRPALTAERFVPDPWSTVSGARLYRTGDLARLLSDGRLDCLGRVDSQVKVRGFRVELGEIESALTALPGVSGAAVVTRQQAAGDLRLIAFLTLEEGALVERDWRVLLQRRLPEYMVPSRFVEVASLPLTASGKVDRRALASTELAPSGGEARGALPVTPVEEILAGLWAELLGLEPGTVGRDADFFALGGHSLLATRLLARLRDMLGVEVPLRRLFERSTVAGFAAAVDEARNARPAPWPSLVPAPPSGAMPLSFAQQRLWFLEQLEPGTAAYNLPGALRLRGVLDRDALARSLHEIARRHAILRARFVTVDGEPRQVVEPPGEASLPVVDLSALPPEERGSVLADLLAAAARRPFELARGPLWRAFLVRSTATEHVLSLTLHHIVSDAWSHGILARELGTLYAAFAEGTSSPLAPLPVQYADYAVWQRGWLTGAVLDDELRFWRQRLADASPLELPTDRPRTRRRDARGGSVATRWSSELTAGLRALARGHGTTLFMVVLAGLAAFLGRLAGQRAVSLGTPIAGRRLAALEDLIGFFANTLVLRTELPPRATFGELLTRAREVCLDAFAHQDVPFEQLAAELQGERDLSRTALFQAFLALQNVPQEALQLPGLELEPVSVSTGTAKFELSLLLAEDGERIAGILHFDRRLFDRSTVERWSHQLVAGLERAVAEPGLRLEELAWSTAAERFQLLVEQNECLPVTAERTLPELFASSVAEAPDAVAVVCGGEACTFAALDARAERLAARLGVGLEGRVGICVERSLGMIVAVLAVLKAGGAYVPLDPDAPADRLAFQLTDSGARAVLSQRRVIAERHDLDFPDVLLIDEDVDAPASPSARSLPSSLAYVIYTSGSTGRPKGVGVEHRQVVSYTSALLRRLELDAARASFATVSTLAADLGNTSIFAALASGGTLHVLDREAISDPQIFAETMARGRVDVLKIVPSHLEALLSDLGVRQDACAPSGRGDVCTSEPGARAASLRSASPAPGYTLAPLQGASDRNRESHTPSSSPLFTLSGVTEGSGAAIRQGFQPQEAPPSGMGPMGRSDHTELRPGPRPRSDAYASPPILGSAIPTFLPVRRLILGGEPCSETLLSTLRERCPQNDEPWLLNHYGPTETAIGVATCRPTPQDLALPLGRPLDGNRLHVVDRQLRPALYGAVGELAIAGAQLARGYLGRGALTAERFVPDPWSDGGRLYLSGDLVRRLVDGRLVFVGRRDQQVKIRGFRVELGEIEDALRRLDGLRQAAVILSERPGEPARLVAFVVADAAMQPDAETLRAELAGRLPAVMVPSMFVFLGELPLNANGKLDRRALVVPESTPSTATEHKLGAVEELMATIWASVLGCDAVGPEADFFALGGHSLLAAQLISRVRDAFDVDLPLRALFEEPTVAGLSAAVKAARGVASRPITPQDAEIAPLSFAQRRMFFLHRLGENPAAFNLPAAVRLIGELDVTAWRAALAEILRRHQVLRATFELEGGEPWQRHRPFAGLTLPVVDLSGLDADRRRREAERLFEAEARRPFDLAKDVLLRAAVLRLAEREHVALLTLHHLASDAWSRRVVLMRELAQLYCAFKERRPSPLAAPRLQYSDFAAWQRRTLQGEALAEHVAFFRRYLDGARPCELPADRPRPAVQRSRGARLAFTVPAARAAELRRLARQHQVTPFLTILAVFKVLLRHETKRDDIVIGTNLAGRDRSELEGLIGLFIQQLVLRTELAGDPTFGELLGRVRRSFLDAAAHQDLPFEKLVEELAPRRDPSRHPLFQIKLEMQNAVGAPPSLPGLELEILDHDPGVVRYDLHLSLVEMASGEMVGSLLYDTALFEPATARRLARRFELLLAAVLATPSVRLSELDAGLATADKEARDERRQEKKKSNLARLVKARRRSVDAVRELATGVER